MESWVESVAVLGQGYKIPELGDPAAELAELYDTY